MRPWYMVPSGVAYRYASPRVYSQKYYAARDRVEAEYLITDWR